MKCSKCDGERFTSKGTELIPCPRCDGSGATPPTSLRERIARTMFNHVNRDEPEPKVGFDQVMQACRDSWLAKADAVLNALGDAHPEGAHRCAESDKLAIEGIGLAVQLKHERDLVARQANDLRAALAYVEGRIRRQFTQYTGDDAVEYLKERGTLVIDEDGRERPPIILWKRLTATLAEVEVEFSAPGGGGRAGREK